MAESTRFRRTEKFSPRIAAQLELIFSVDAAILFPFILAALGTIITSFVAAANYSKFGKNPDMVKYGVSTDKLSVSLYVAGGLQIVMCLVLAVRGLTGGKEGWQAQVSAFFKSSFVQAVLFWHIFLPNLLITGTWAGRVAIDATVVANANADKLLEVNSALKMAWALHSAAFVFSNVFSSMVLAFITTNTAHFQFLSDIIA